MHHDIISICGDSKFSGETTTLIHTGAGGPPLRQSYSLPWFCLSDTKHGDSKKVPDGQFKTLSPPLCLLSHRFGLFQWTQYSHGRVGQENTNTQSEPEDLPRLLTLRVPLLLSQNKISSLLIKEKSKTFSCSFYGNPLLPNIYLAIQHSKHTRKYYVYSLYSSLYVSNTISACTFQCTGNHSARVVWGSKFHKF